MDIECAGTARWRSAYGWYSEAYDRSVTSVQRWMIGLCFALALGGVQAAAESVKDLPQPTSYVSDFAGVIDAGSRAQMEQLAAEVEREAHATIEIVTIKSLDGQPIEEFATALEDKWKVGPKNTDRGVLMIFAMNDRKRRIEVGNGLEGVLNDAKVGDIGRGMNQELQAGDYGQAILEGEQQVANDIAADAGVTLTPLPQRPRPRQAQHSRGGLGFLPILILFVFLWLIFRGGRGGRGGGGGPGSGLGWFLLGNMLGSGRRGGGFGGGGFDGGGGGGGGGNDDGGFGGGFGGGSEGGGASGSW